MQRLPTPTEITALRDPATGALAVIAPGSAFVGLFETESGLRATLEQIREAIGKRERMASAPRAGDALFGWLETEAQAQSRSAMHREAIDLLLLKRERVLQRLATYPGAVERYARFEAMCGRPVTALAALAAE